MINKISPDPSFPKRGIEEVLPIRFHEEPSF